MRELSTSAEGWKACLGKHGKKKSVDVEETLSELRAKGDNGILNSNYKVIWKPESNAKCPCGSKKRYRKCICSVSDRRRTDEFVRS